jgi:hypothetical protein
MSVFIVGANTTFRTLYIQLSSTTYFGSFWSASGSFYNNMHEEEYRNGWLPLKVNAMKIYTIIPCKAIWEYTVVVKMDIQ